MTDGAGVSATVAPEGWKLEPGDGSQAFVGLDGRGRVRVPPGVRHRLGLDGAVLVSVAVDRNVIVISPDARRPRVCVGVIERSVQRGHPPEQERGRRAEHRPPALLEVGPGQIEATPTNTVTGMIDGRKGQDIGVLHDPLAPEIGRSRVLTANRSAAWLDRGTGPQPVAWTEESEDIVETRPGAGPCARPPCRNMPVSD